MKEASEETGLATICEVISTASLEAAVKYVDMVQIGARNMQNFQLLREVGRSGHPVLLKRGMAATIVFGLSFATLLTHFVTPALYAIFYQVKKSEA